MNQYKYEHKYEIKFSDYIKDIGSREKVIVCGLGTSLRLLRNPDDFITIGCNDIGRMFTPTYLTIANMKADFTEERWSWVQRNQCEIVFTSGEFRIPNCQRVIYKLGKLGEINLDDPEHIGYSHLSPFISIVIAYHLGFKRIGMIGVDFTEHHAFAKTGRHVLTNDLPRIEDHFITLNEKLQEKGVELVNLSPFSQLQAIKKERIEKFYLAK